MRISSVSIAPALLKEGSVQCSKCSKRSLSSQWRLQSFFSHCSARSRLARFLPRATKIPDGSVVQRSCGRNATGRKLLIVAKNVARHGTALEASGTPERRGRGHVMTLACLMLAIQCWRVAGALTLFVEATLLGRRSLPRIVLARFCARALCWLILTGKRLAPEAMQD
jgi:hypothetical protein